MRRVGGHGMSARNRQLHPPHPPPLSLPSLSCSLCFTIHTPALRVFLPTPPPTHSLHLPPTWPCGSWPSSSSASAPPAPAGRPRSPSPETHTHHTHITHTQVRPPAQLATNRPACWRLVVRHALGYPGQPDRSRGAKQSPGGRVGGEPRAQLQSAARTCRPGCRPAPALQRHASRCRGCLISSRRRPPHSPSSFPDRPPRTAAAPPREC